ncbi:MAG: hypothetical protein ABIP33_07250 [Pseudolysinimonas sp.]
MRIKFSPLLRVLLAIVAASGIAMAVLAAIDGTVTGDWVDATSTVGFPAVGFIELAMAGLGVLVFLGALAIFIALLASSSRKAGSQA